MKYKTWSSIIAILFTAFLFIIASIGWLSEHLYNLYKGRGWIGMRLR